MTEEKMNWKKKLASRLLEEKESKSFEDSLQYLVKVNIVLTFLSLCFVAGNQTAESVGLILVGLI